MTFCAQQNKLGHFVQSSSSRRHSLVITSPASNRTCQVFPIHTTNSQPKMSSAVSKTWKLVKPHVPLIQFKKGGRGSEVTSKSSSNSPKAGNSTLNILSESMLPKKYFRKPISQIEIQAIELGGVQAL